MKTSYFAKFKGKNGVCVAVKSPPGFKGYYYPDLYPKQKALWQFKKDGDRKKFTKAYYNQVLNKLDPQLIWDDLKDDVLLCWEGAGRFCHRRIIAEWLENELGVVIPEIQ